MKQFIKNFTIIFSHVIFLITIPQALFFANITVAPWQVAIGMFIMAGLCFSLADHVENQVKLN